MTVKKTAYIQKQRTQSLLNTSVFLASVGICAALVGCEKAPALSKSESLETPLLGEINEESPYLGAISDEVPIYSKVSLKSAVIGTLHAGARVRRTNEFVENADCISGWYQIAPRGYVCTEKSATLDENHPTLKVMALRAQQDKALPYVYARTTSTTSLFKKAQRKGVELSGRVPRNTVMAIVGSWTAPDESHEPQRLGLRMDGRFVRADDLEAAQGSSFRGVSLNDVDLPTAYVVRRGVYHYEINEETQTQQKLEKLDYHEHLGLTGKRATIKEKSFWQEKDGSWVRHQDVTVVRGRHQFPDFVKPGVKWLDISVITGTLTAYEGDSPQYSTLVSVGRDRMGDPEITASTPRGNFRIVEKHLTRRAHDSEASLLDAPWAFKLENGTWLYASPRHNRFGIEHTDGALEVSPQDGAHIFAFMGPELPEGGNSLSLDESTPLWVQIRK